jgi:hypothetical protein
MPTVCTKDQPRFPQLPLNPKTYRALPTKDVEILRPRLGIHILEHHTGPNLDGPSGMAIGKFLIIKLDRLQPMRVDD